jgi:hypothetical protein
MVGIGKPVLARVGLYKCLNSDIINVSTNPGQISSDVVTPHCALWQPFDLLAKSLPISALFIGCNLFPDPIGRA